MKILANIARRHNTDELPDRRELVEMDLFDTDRNPWDPSGSGGGDELWQRFEYQQSPPYEIPYDSTNVGVLQVGPVDLVVERFSLAFAFVSGVIDVTTGTVAGFNQANLRMEVDDSDGNTSLAVGTLARWQSSGSGIVMSNPGSSAWTALLNPGTYTVNVWSWVWSNQGSNGLLVNMVQNSAVIGLLPAGRLGYTHLIGT